AAGAPPPGTMCGSVSLTGNGGVPNPDGAVTENACQGVPFWALGCPAGYVYTTVFAADAVWFGSCVKT
ncbi:hypothetical protein, partial [Paraburkholderia fungorum]